MDKYNFIILLLNFLTIILTLIENVYAKIKADNHFKNINKNLHKEILSINQKSNDFLINNISGPHITKFKLNNTFSQNEEVIYIMYLLLQISAEYFSAIYKNNSLFCNLRIKEQNNFKTIVQYYYDEELKNIDIKPQEYYPINNNTDLINISQNHFNIFVINNISDYKKRNSFSLQNSRMDHMEKLCDALITIPIYSDPNDDILSRTILACHTVYFTKPLNENIKMNKMNYSLNILINKMNELIKAYLQINSDKKENDNQKEALLVKLPPNN